MNLLMLQIMNQPIQLRIFGFVSLNRSLLYEVLTAATSYLVVVVQYELENQ